MAEWAVEVLNDLVEAELLSLPKDMQARFSQNFGTAGECRAAACRAAARETSGRE